MNLRKTILSVAITFLALNVNAQYVYEIDSPVDYVNPLMGTQSKFLLSHGNVYPAIALS